MKFEKFTCPICDKYHYDEDDFYDFECPNGCFSYFLDNNTGTSTVMLYLDEKQFIYTDIDLFGNEGNKSLKNDLINRILYWKENDRYLMKIISGE